MPVIRGNHVRPAARGKARNAGGKNRAHQQGSMVHGTPRIVAIGDYTTPAVRQYVNRLNTLIMLHLGRTSPGPRTGPERRPGRRAAVV